MVWWITGVSISESNISANGQLLRLYLVPTLFSFSEGVLVCLDVVSSTLMHHFDTVVPLSPLPLSLSLSRPLSFFFSFRACCSSTKFHNVSHSPSHQIRHKFTIHQRIPKRGEERPKQKKGKKKGVHNGETTKQKKKCIFIYFFFF